MMPLILASEGDENIIKKIGGSPEVKKHLENLGFVVGGNVKVVTTVNGNLIVNVKEARVAINEEMARKILRRLKFDNQTIKQVTTLVRWHDRRFASIEEVNKKTVRRWVSQLTPELFTRLMEVQKADISAQSDYQRDKKEQVLQETKKLFEEIIEEKNCLSIKELKINGKDLMDMGVPQGKEIGQILSWLLDQVLEDPQLNERETLTRMAEEKRDEK